MCTLIGFIQEYEAFFNAHEIFTDTFGKGTSILFLFMLLLLSLYLVFHINSFVIAKKVVDLTPDRKTMQKKMEGIFARYEKDTEPQPKKSSGKTKEIIFQTAKKQTSPSESVPVSDAVVKKSPPTSVHIPIVKKEQTTLIDQIKNPFSKTKDEKKEISAPSYADWELPSLDLLADFEVIDTFDIASVEEKQQKIIEKLAQFKIHVHITQYKIGPTVIQFRLKPEE